MIDLMWNMNQPIIDLNGSKIKGGKDNVWKIYAPRLRTMDIRGFFK